MKAEREDAPDRLNQTFISALIKWAIPTIFGTAVCFGLLAFFSSIAVKNEARQATQHQVQTTAPKFSQPRPEYRPLPRVQAHPEVRIQEHAQVYTPRIEEPKPKQTEFNDRNYLPRGADNSVGRLAEIRQQPVQEKSGISVSGIHEKRKVKDLCPDPSSIAGRECRLRIGVQVRN